jgi:hypothetical protein
MRLGLALALGGLALAARTAAAQGACDDIARIFKKPPKIGEWADIQMDLAKDKGKKPTMMRVGVVDQEQRGPDKLYRMQMVMTDHGNRRQIMQTLTLWGEDALTRDFDSDIVMKMGDQPAMIMPFKGGRNQPGMTDLRRACTKLTFVGEEQVTVPAGTFDTRHYTGPDGDSWVAPDIPGLRMAKMVTKKGDTMVLTATGTGAKNEITETPMDMKAMMGGGMGKGKPKDTEEEDAK